MPADVEARVGLLGPLHLRVAGRDLGAVDLGGRKTKQVLEVLLLHERRFSKGVVYLGYRT